MKNNLILALLLSFLYVNSDAQTISGSFDFDGLTRTYSYYVPTSYSVGSPVPLIVNLHGLGSSGTEQANYANFMPIADTANFIIVHPDGTKNQQNKNFWNFGVPGETVDDFGFLEALIDTISANYTINQNRIYSTGLSNGGYMSYLFACESNRFAAIASVAASMTVPMYNSCNPDYPIPVMEIHGTNDAVVPYYGNVGNKSVEDVIDFWVDKNNCNTTPTVTQVPDNDPTDGATAENYLYSDGTDGHTVEFYKVTGGGHTWPGGTVAIPSLGNTCMDFNASKEIWRFFSQHNNSYASVNDEEITNNYLSVYPNPTSGKLTIKLEKTSSQPYILTVNDVQGREVYRQENNQLELHLNLNPLRPGLYTLNIRNSVINTTSSIVIE